MFDGKTAKHAALIATMRPLSLWWTCSLRENFRSFWIRSKPSSREATLKLLYWTDFRLFFFLLLLFLLLHLKNGERSSQRGVAFWGKQLLGVGSLWKYLKGSEFPGRIPSFVLHSARVSSICFPAKDGLLTRHSRCTVGCVHKCKYTQIQRTLEPAHTDLLSLTHTHTHVDNSGASQGTGIDAVTLWCIVFM